MPSGCMSAWDCMCVCLGGGVLEYEPEGDFLSQSLAVEAAAAVQ